MVGRLSRRITGSVNGKRRGTLHIHMKTANWHPLNIVEERGRGEMGYKVICRGGELVQNTVHATKELS
jgi:hypothetical protein